MSNTKTALSVLSFGEILWDSIDGKKYLGGAPLNFAAHVVKCGGSSAIVSSVGDDELGKDAIQKLSALEVNPAFIQICKDKPTGTVDVFLSHGQPDYIIHEDVAFDFISSTSLNRILPDEFNAFYFGSLAQRNKMSRSALQWILNHYKFDHIFYDINLRKNYYSTEIVQNSLQQCTILKINDDEVKIISKLFFNQVLTPEEFAQRIANNFEIGIIIITAGAKGCYVLSNGKFEHVPAVATTVADTIGAGDAFSAAFMCEYCKSYTVREAAITGNKIGAYVASANGAIPDYSDEIKNYLK